RNRRQRLEHERNDLRRSKLHEMEIGKQQERIYSSQIVALETKHTSAALELENEQKNLETLRQQRDELTGQRSKVEAERRHFEELTVTQRNQERIDAERKIAEASIGLSRAATKAKATKTNRK